MASARDRVFATPELLEAILIQLHHVAPLHELLQAQLISHRLHTAITSSPRLQQLLFFRAQPNNVSRSSAAWTLNPLLRHHFLPWFVQPSDRWSMPNQESIQALDWIPARKDAFLRPEASWRKMLVIQPPPKTLSVTLLVHTRLGDFISDATDQCADSPSGGVTMASLYDITESFVRTESSSQFGLTIKDGDTGPRMTLRLAHTQQCCPSSPKNYQLMSQGAKSNHEARALEWKGREPQEDSSRRRQNPIWDTDLVPDRGGVSSWDWEEWKRKRAPISDLLSDVRGG
ncbi:hypothetical protein BKA66DRAFT_458317 [Pyrenochaeta sp. MPI-SDFR-AT-0127]|nr:hypothetical protein BKA66DRAFT_458317 [Pyrenochaeta sp. MPI-SDFR-AT-0127]